MPIIDQPSPNFNDRRGGAVPSIVLIHYTATESAAKALSWLRDPASGVSAHYLIDEAGRITRLVDERQRAWHAGQGAWGGLRDINSHSIGIELQNFAKADHFPPYPEAQMLALEALLHEITTRWTIPLARVLGHSDTAVGRKIDPGPRFDWGRLARAGLAIWPGDVGTTRSTSMRRFLSAAWRLGYRARGPKRREALLHAFRLRFRPTISGPLTPQDIALIEALAERHPCIDPSPRKP